MNFEYIGSGSLKRIVFKEGIILQKLSPYLSKNGPMDIWIKKDFGFETYEIRINNLNSKEDIIKLFLSVDGEKKDIAKLALKYRELIDEDLVWFE